MERLSILYASALFDLAMQRNAVDDFLRQAVLLRDALKDPECKRLLEHPQISAAEKREFFNKSFEGQINEDMLGFLYLVVDKNRIKYLYPALGILIGNIERRNNIVTARVFSASPFDETQAGKLREMLSEKLNKHCELDLKIDTSVIGGPYIFVDGYYIDWTVKKRLNDLTINLKEQRSVKNINS